MSWRKGEAFRGAQGAASVQAGSRLPLCPRPSAHCAPLKWMDDKGLGARHTVKGFGIVNKAEIDIFWELSCLCDDPADVGNVISGSSVFFKTSLNIWKFTVHVLLKPGLENFEHYFTSL